MSNRFQILSLDGGGLKGVFTASFLTSLENTTGKKIVDYFDLIVGTSTGGIIALALGLGFSPTEILGFYKARGEDIFPAQGRWHRAMVSVKWLLRRKYPAEPLRQALQNYFGERRLGESTKRLIIPSYDSVRGDVYLYKTPHHQRLKTDYKELAWSVALATASAPTYFPASIDDTGVRLIDGGMWANNPSMVALAEALGYFGQAQDSIAMLSIGTTQEAVTSMDKHITGGLWAWRRKTLEFMMAGQNRAAENQCFHILGKERFLRVNPLVAGHYALDKMSLELEGIGRTEARNAVNEVESMFLHNKAAPYNPMYSLKDPQDKHEYSEEKEANVD